MARKRSEGMHAYLPELRERLRKGEIDRREFLRTATLLGVSATAAYAMSGVVSGGPLVSATRAATPKKGGNLRVSMAVKEMTDPATYDWSEKGNPGAPHDRAHGADRRGRGSQAPSGGRLESVGGSQDMGLPPAPGGQVVKRRRLRRRRCHPQLQALAGPQDRVVQSGPLQFADEEGGYRQEGQGRQADDIHRRQRWGTGESRRPHRPLPPQHAGPVTPREPGRLSGAHRPPPLRRGRGGSVEKSRGHRRLHPQGVRGR